MAREYADTARAWGSQGWKGRGRQVGMSDIASAVSALGNSDLPEVKKALRAAQAKRVWESVVPQVVCDHTDNVYLIRKRDEDGHLYTDMYVHVDSPMWNAELTAQSEKYRRDVEALLGGEKLHRVYFKTDHMVSRKKEFVARVREVPSYVDGVETVPLTEGERARVEELASKIQSKELREALTRACIADLEWKKGLETASNKGSKRL